MVSEGIPAVDSDYNDVITGVLKSCGRPLRTQKSKSPLQRTKGCHLSYLKCGVGQNIAMRASPTARNFFPPNLYLPSHFNVRYVAKNGFPVDPENILFVVARDLYRFLSWEPGI